MCEMCREPGGMASCPNCGKLVCWDIEQGDDKTGVPFGQVPVLHGAAHLLMSFVRQSRPSVGNDLAYLIQRFVAALLLTLLPFGGLLA